MEYMHATPSGKAKNASSVCFYTYFLWLCYSMVFPVFNAMVFLLFSVLRTSAFSECLILN